MTTQTVNIGLIKDGPNEFYDVTKVNANLDIIDGAIEEALDKANQAFQSASDGKTVIASSITAKGVNASKEDTFPTLASKIDSIEIDPSIGTTNAVAGDILLGKKVISEGKLLTGTIPTRGATTITPTTVAQNISANQYLSGVQTIAGVVVPLANVLAGITIAGAIGTMPNRGAPAQTITTQGGQYNIPAGYFSGGSVKAQFANLVAGNVKSGVNIGGVVGTLVDVKPTRIHFKNTGTSPGVPVETGIAFKVDSLYMLIAYDRNYSRRHRSYLSWDSGASFGGQAEVSRTISSVAQDVFFLPPAKIGDEIKYNHKGFGSIIHYAIYEIPLSTDTLD